MDKSCETSRILKSFRTKKGKTLEEASSDIGWHFNTYSRRENNPFNASILEICKMTNNLDGNFEELFYAIEQDFKSYKNAILNTEEQEE